MKPRILFLLLSAFFVTSAYAQSTFVINGDCKQMKDGDKVYLTYKANKKIILDSTLVKNRKFRFTGIITEPVKAGVYHNENPMLIEYTKGSINLYLEAGNIFIKSKDTLNNATVGGTSLNRDMQLFQDKSAVLKETAAKYKDPDFFTEEEKNDTAFVRINEENGLINMHNRIILELAFAREHPESQVSLELIAKNSWQKKFINETEAVYIVLSDSMKNTALGLTIKENINRARRIGPGMEAKDFTMYDMYGKAVSLSSYKGQYVLLDFWASWCLPCRAEHPNLIAAYEKYKQAGFTILSVSIDTNRDSWLKAVEKDGLTWTQISDLKGEKGEAHLLYGITTIPANYLIGPDGKIIAQDIKGTMLATTLEKVLSNK
jgi:peroxiredoxin